MLLKTKSNNLKDVSYSDNSRYDLIKEDSFKSWNDKNIYRTSYSEMFSSVPKQVNVHYVPNYKGFVPRVKSENMFGRNYTKLSNAGIRKFEEIRYSGNDSDNYKE